MKTNKKHQTERTSIQELTQLFEEFNKIYNEHFFLNVINTNQPKKKKTMKATQLINAMQYRQRYTIKNSKKDFIIFDKTGQYMLTSDLARHRHKYMDGGTFAALECIKNDIKL